jgi:hypothetical protein
MPQERGVAKPQSDDVPDLKGTDNFYLILAFIVPGLVIVYIRSRFISGKTPSHTENILGYLVLSLLYYTFTLPFIQLGLSIQDPWQVRAAIWIGLTLIGPALFGVFLGAWAQKEWGTWFADRLGLTTIHVIPAAWDWRFSKIPRGGMFVMVTLTSGESVAGFFGPNSFASSDEGERDIYIEEEYDVDEEGIWKPRSAKVGILIPVKEIRNIEFWEP